MSISALLAIAALATLQADDKCCGTPFEKDKTYTVTYGVVSQFDWDQIHIVSNGPGNWLLVDCIELKSRSVLRGDQASESGESGRATNRKWLNSQYILTAVEVDETTKK